MRNREEFQVIISFGEDILTEKTLVVFRDGRAITGGRIGDVVLSAAQVAGIVDTSIAGTEDHAA